jgi:hypothetical protein
VIATATTAFIQLHKFGYVAGYFRGWELWFHGVLTGAVVGAFFWILMRPGARFSQAILVAIATNWIVWALFLLMTPPLQDFEFQEIAKQRATRDERSGLDLMTDQPTIIASRWWVQANADFGAPALSDGRRSCFSRIRVCCPSALFRGSAESRRVLGHCHPRISGEYGVLGQCRWRDGMASETACGGERPGR